MAPIEHTSNKLRNLDYDKIPLQKVQLLPIVFDGDVLFEFSSIFLTIHRPSHMQGMDRSALIGDSSAFSQV
jgi:hypothetical protein